jgi:hypothetical protein
MAGRDDPDDIEKLLADVERTLGGGTSSSPPAKRPSSEPEKASRGGAFSSALTVALVAAGASVLIFALVPFVGAFSAAWGAFITAFVLTLWARLRGR